ncbi:MAG: hypothetical protein L3J03_03695 [Desulfobacterales bacterium]|nr:hypothetical protein [Desulfobacterales bacterium]
MTGKKNIPLPGPDSQIKPVSDEAILKVAKEIVVKFIEVGRLSPGNFGETFDSIYRSVHDTVRS